MRVTDVEELTLRAFLVPSRKKRWIQALQSKRRSKATARLYHDFASDLDPRYAEPIPSSRAGAETLYAILHEKGAPERCHAVSAHADLDRRELDLRTALERIAAGAGGTLLSCIPGKLAYFEGEDPGDRYVLSRA